MFRSFLILKMEIQIEKNKITRRLEKGITLVALVITIEEGITSIGTNMFYNCYGMQKMYYKGNEYTSASH